MFHDPLYSPEVSVGGGIAVDTRSHRWRDVPVSTEHFAGGRIKYAERWKANTRSQKYIYRNGERYSNVNERNTNETKRTRNMFAVHCRRFVDDGKKWVYFIRETSDLRK